MRLKTQIVYDEKDILKLNHMSLRECVDALNDIAFGVLPTNFVVLDDEDEDEGAEYSQDEYDATRYHAAIKMSIDRLSAETTHVDARSYKYEPKGNYGVGIYA